MSLVFFKKLRATKRVCILLCIYLLLFSSFSLVACKKEIDYFQYVSDLRSNIYLAKTEEFSLKIYCSVKESPYTPDGIPRETFSRIEAYMVAPDSSKTVHIRIQNESSEFGGEMSHDSVRGEYYYFTSHTISNPSALTCHIQYGETEFSLTASSVLTENTLSPKQALQSLRQQHADVFSSLTDKYGFSGEIHLRLLYEGAPYYYFGIIDREGNCNAFLMNAQTGKVLAKREN